MTEAKVEIKVREGELGEAVVAAMGQIVATTLVVGLHGKSLLYSNLSGLNLGGEISPAIGDLKSVVSFDLKSNGLSGRSLMRLVIVHRLKYCDNSRISDAWSQPSSH